MGYIRKWRVKSVSGDKEYVVALTDKGEWQCSCPVWIYRRRECHHIRCVKSTPDRNTKEVIEPPVIVQAKVREVTRKDNKLLVPLIPLRSDAFHFQMTVFYDLLMNGYPMSYIRERYHLPSWMKEDAVFKYIQRYGRAILTSRALEDPHLLFETEIKPVEEFVR